MDPKPRSGARIKPVALTALVCLALVGVLFALQSANATRVSAQTSPCVQIFDPRVITAPKIITFDDLPDKTPLNTQYEASYGVTFPNQNPPPIIHTVPAGEMDTPQTPPNVAQNVFTPGVPHTALMINLGFPRTHVGVFLGNGNGQITAVFTALDAAGGPLCTFRIPNVSMAHTTFAGAYDSLGRIEAISIVYSPSATESIDNLYLAPGANYSGRKPLPRWTPVPTPAPTQGPAPTATPVLPVFPLYAYQIPVNTDPGLLPTDFRRVEHRDHPGGAVPQWTTGRLRR